MADNKLLKWLKEHKPTKRRLIQVYSALLYNANIKGFFSGKIYKGNTKNLCVPGLNCYSCPGAVGSCPLGSIQNSLTSSNTSSLAYIFGIMILFGMVFGRTVCGFLCPFGLIQEWLNKIPSPKIGKNRFTRVLSYFKYVVLVVAVVGIPLAYAGKLPVPGFCKYICPSGTLLGAVSLLSNSSNDGLFAMLGPLFTWKFCLLVFFIVASVFIFRFFCRFLCPLGAIYGFFSRLALLGIKLEKDKCIGCGLCVSGCKMDVRHVGDHECINCGECISVCPVKAIQWKGSGFILHKNDIPVCDNQKEKTSSQENIPPKTKLLKIISAVVSFIILAGALVYFNFIEKDEIYGYEIGNKCPDFVLSGIGGDNDFRLSENEGKVIVINFWATWCGPCLEELPYFESAADELGENVKIVAVHSSSYTEGFLEQRGWEDWTLEFVQDIPQSDGSMFFDIIGMSDALPVTVIVDAEGIITFRNIGKMEYDELKQAINDAMN